LTNCIKTTDNQWQVDFNLTLPSFTPHLAGTLNLITLSSSSAFFPPIFFTSSIGTLGNWDSIHPGSVVPEKPLADPRIPLSQGYGESKWIAERLSHFAQEKSGVSSAVLRVGQIAGPVGIEGGEKWEWLPSIVASSGCLGLIPADLAGKDGIAWIPVDILARIIWDLVEGDCTNGKAEEAWTKYYHLTNPHESRWKDLVPAILEHFSRKNDQKSFRAVTFAKWVESLGKSANEKDVDVEKTPAIKLLDFYHGMSDGSGEIGMRLETKDTQIASQTMRGLRGVGKEWMELWLDQWKF
jgi:nucleoside-diphosphate-sugar epimerase